MTTYELPPRQAEVVCWIARHLELYRRPPTYRWLMERMDIESPNGVFYHLNALAKKGWIVRGTKAACAMLAGARLHATGKPALEPLGTPQGWRLANVLVGLAGVTQGDRQGTPGATSEGRQTC